MAKEGFCWDHLLKMECHPGGGYYRVRCEPNKYHSLHHPLTTTSW